MVKSVGSVQKSKVVMSERIVRSIKDNSNLNFQRSLKSDGNVPSSEDRHQSASTSGTPPDSKQYSPHVQINVETEEGILVAWSPTLLDLRLMQCKPSSVLGKIKGFVAA